MNRVRLAKVRAPPDETGVISPTSYILAGEGLPRILVDNGASFAWAHVLACHLLSLWF